MDPASLLAEIIAQGGRISSATFDKCPSLNLLQQNGFLEESGVVQSILCDECSQPHDAPLVFEEGQYGLYCPEIGFTVKQRSELTAWALNWERLVSNLATVLACKRTKSSPVQGQTWRVGVVARAMANVVVYLHPMLRDERDLKALKDALAREPNENFGVVLSANGTLSSPPFKTALIEDCLIFNEGEGRFEVDADLATIAGAPSKPKGGRPSPYQPRLSNLVAARKVDGTALPGVNAEAKAIQAILRSENSAGCAPSLPTIKRSMTSG